MGRDLVVLRVENSAGANSKYARHTPPTAPRQRLPEAVDGSPKGSHERECPPPPDTGHPASLGLG